MLAWIFSGNGEIPDGREMGGFARIVTDGFVSAAVIDLGDGRLAFVDAGNDKEGKALRGGTLAARGRIFAVASTATPTTTSCCELETTTAGKVHLSFAITRFYADFHKNVNHPRCRRGKG
jgi:hypothetical protein